MRNISKKFYILCLLDCLFNIPNQFFSNATKNAGKFQWRGHIGRRNYMYLNLSSPRTISPYTYTYTFVRNHKLSKGNRPIVLVMKIFKKPIVIYFLWGRKRRGEKKFVKAVYLHQTQLWLLTYLRGSIANLSVYIPIYVRGSPQLEWSRFCSVLRALSERGGPEATWQPFPLRSVLALWLLMVLGPLWIIWYR